MSQLQNSTFRSIRNNTLRVDVIDIRQLKNLLRNTYFDRLRAVCIKERWIGVTYKYIKHDRLYIDGDSSLEIDHEGRINDQSITAIKSSVSRKPILVGFMEDYFEDNIVSIQLTDAQFNTTRRGLLFDKIEHIVELNQNTGEKSEYYICEYKGKTIKYNISKLPMKFIKVTWIPS